MARLPSSFENGSNAFIRAGQWAYYTRRYAFSLGISSNPQNHDTFFKCTHPLHLDGAEEGLTKAAWEALNVDGVVSNADELYRLVYFGGCDHDIRKDVWPFLLGHYAFGSTIDERNELDETSRHYYETTMSEWLAVEAIVRQRDKEKTAIAVAKLSSESGKDDHRAKSNADLDDMENDVFEENGFSDTSDPEYANEHGNERTTEAIAKPIIVKPTRANKNSDDSGNVADSNDSEMENTNCKEIAESESMEKQAIQTIHIESIDLQKDTDEYKLAVEEMSSQKSTPSSSSYETVANDFIDLAAQLDDIDKMEVPPMVVNHPQHAVIITDASIDIVAGQKNDKQDDQEKGQSTLSPLHEESNGHAVLDALQEPKSACVSPASSNGGIYSVRILEVLKKMLGRSFFLFLPDIFI